MNHPTAPAPDDRVRRFLARAVELSREGSESGCGGPFGAVVVRGDEIVGEGCNRVPTDNDPTAHAEMVAIRAACKRLGTFGLAGCEIFASSQPCPMCLAAIYWARIDRVWFANTVEDARAIGFDDSKFYDELSLPLERRSIPQVHVATAEALKVFKDWAADPANVRY